MSNYKLRFRQIHLDFHTSPHIPGIGEKFDKKQWQEALQVGHVNSITTFSKCHHGWSYHPTNVGKIHPNLNFDLLRAQFDASKEIGVNVPIYLSAGVDSVAGYEHPEWRELSYEGAYSGWCGPIHQAGFMTMCFNSPYLGYLCDQISEAVRLFPDGDGIFLDIIFQGDCCCTYCLDYMAKNGLDADKPEDRAKCSQHGLNQYYIETTKACKCDNPNYPIFHNSGHVTKGNRDILKHFSHLELESLPTGGWGYDHFPMSANYVQNLGLDFLGMTGKFHTTWGEFGGFKHPNALKYECAAMLAYGSKCSVGDQLHPSGEADMTTYKLIGEAYADVEAKEAWCDNVTGVADIGVLSSEAEFKSSHAETGASRVLLEGHFLFNLLDRECDFAPYKLMILPDGVLIDEALKAKVDAYLAGGGKLLLTGASGLKADGSGFAFDTGADWFGESEFSPDFIQFADKVAPSFIQSPLVMYRKSQRIKVTDGENLGTICDPYFNRSWKHFCSHQHAPSAGPTEFASGVSKGNITYLAHPVFTIYYAMGAVAYKEYAVNVINSILGCSNTVKTNMPSTARVSIKEQPEENRYILHLLYANTISRGATGGMHTTASDERMVSVEVIEELLPLHDVKVDVCLPKEIKKITLEPQGVELPIKIENGRISIEQEKLVCHQMVVLHY